MATVVICHWKRKKRKRKKTMQDQVMATKGINGSVASAPIQIIHGLIDAIF